MNLYGYCSGNPVGFVDPSGYTNVGGDNFYIFSFTGDTRVDLALSKWYATNPQIRYGNDPRYHIQSVTGFQNGLLYYVGNTRSIQVILGE